MNLRRPECEFFRGYRVIWAYADEERAYPTWLVIEHRDRALYACYQPEASATDLGIALGVRWGHPRRTVAKFFRKIGVNRPVGRPSAALSERLQGDGLTWEAGEDPFAPFRRREVENGNA